MWPLPVTKEGSLLCTLSQPLLDSPYPSQAGHGVLSISCSLPTQVPSPIPSPAQLNFPCRGGVGDSDFHGNKFLTPPLPAPLHRLLRGGGWGLFTVHVTSAAASSWPGPPRPSSFSPFPPPDLSTADMLGLLNVCSRGLTHLDCILALEGVPALCPPPWDLVSLGSVSWGWEPAVGVGLLVGGGAKSASFFRIWSRGRQPQSLCVLGKGPLETLAKACLIFSVCVVCVGTSTPMHGGA